MERSVRPGTIGGTIRVPASKSHTIRALLIGALAEGDSRIDNPLDSHDTASCIGAARLLGAQVSSTRDDDGRLQALRVRGTAGVPAPAADVVDVGNSGTTLYLAIGSAALSAGWTVFTGDEQIRGRSAANLLQALRDLGAEAFSTRDNGCAPLCIRGPLTGGHTSIECPTSQYLSSLLLAAPLADGDSEIELPLLHEKPYAEMTLSRLDAQGIRYERDGWKRFRIPGGQRYRAFSWAIPGDFSSATFWAVAAAVTGSELTLAGLDPSDPQGDKAVFEILTEMGCEVRHEGADSAEGGAVERADAREAPALGGITIRGPEARREPGASTDAGTGSGTGAAAGVCAGHLRAGRFDLNAIPDALPALTVAGCFADGPVELVNVPQARMKETDRINVMRTELEKLGATIEEHEDGLTIRPQSGRRRAALQGARVDGHADHRVVMSLAVAGLAAAGETVITGAEAAGVTYPGFFETLDAIRR